VLERSQNGSLENNVTLETRIETAFENAIYHDSDESEEAPIFDPPIDREGTRLNHNLRVGIVPLLSVTNIRPRNYWKRCVRETVADRKWDV
jgi:hypothetical protein